MYGLFKALHTSLCSDKWRRFIDSPKISLIVVLLHNGNVLPSIPVTHAFEIKESDDSMKQLLQYMMYYTYKWNICADRKSLHFCLDCRSGTLNFLVSCVMGQQRQGTSLCQTYMVCHRDYGAMTQKST